MSVCLKRSPFLAQARNGISMCHVVEVAFVRLAQEVMGLFCSPFILSQKAKPYTGNHLMHVMIVEGTRERLFGVGLRERKPFDARDDC
ncbi:hypothetical protein FKM82_019574 [Ascaphus truei]